MKMLPQKKYHLYNVLVTLITQCAQKSYIAIRECLSQPLNAEVIHASNSSKELKLKQINKQIFKSIVLDLPLDLFR